MGSGMQVVPQTLRSPNWSLGGNDPVSLESLPTRIFGRIAHLVGFVIDVVYTPTFTTAPTLYGINNFINSIVLFDGINERQNLAGNDLRFSEILENGHLIVPDPKTTSGSNNPFSFRRVLLMGPPSAQGYPTDYLLPCAALKSGELRFKFGSLTDNSADTTAINSVTIRLTAMLVGLDDEIRVSPAFERRAFNFGSNECLIQGSALYLGVGITKANNAAFAAGDLNEITVDTGQGATNSVICSSLDVIGQLQLMNGQFTQAAGEPRNTNDDNARVWNAGAPTALVAADRTLQTVISSPTDFRISKAMYEATSGLRVKWTGTYTTPKLVVSRILEQGRQAAAALAARACSELKLSVPNVAKVKTLSKNTYTGPREAFLPWAFKWKRTA